MVALLETLDIGGVRLLVSEEERAEILKRASKELSEQFLYERPKSPFGQVKAPDYRLKINVTWTIEGRSLGISVNLQDIVRVMEAISPISITGIDYPHYRIGAIHDSIKNKALLLMERHVQIKREEKRRQEEKVGGMWQRMSG